MALLTTVSEWFLVIGEMEGIAGDNDANTDSFIPLYDAHCHPTDTFATVDEIPRLRIAGLCIMATRATDQELVSTTAKQYPDKVVPCFGFHP